jgi:serine phosphatase RsbU (regulator of sigma subunit)
MRSLFRSRASDSGPVVEPVATIFPKIEGADIAGVFTGKRIAGDFYDSIRVSPERILLGLLDVAGRRDETRTLLTAAQQIFRSAGTELFSTPDINESDAMTELSLRINRGLIEASTGVASCPAFIACYHEKFGTLCYTNAGHTPGLLHDAVGITELPSTGLPLGLFSHATAEAPTVAVEKSATLLLVSRGVIECGRDNHRCEDEFGMDRVKDFLNAAPPQGAETLCASLLNAANEYNKKEAPRDDRTALALIRAA